jgi:hypothetical protein
VIRALAKKFCGCNVQAEKPSPFALPEVAANWTTGNADQLAAFLASETGKALMVRLRTLVAANAISGAQVAAATGREDRRSAGWDEAVRYLFSLSRVSGVQDTKTNDEAPRGETEILEHLSP